MRTGQHLRVLTVVGLALSLLGAGASDVLARKYHRDPVRHHPYYGKRVSLPDLIAKSILIGGLEYYYQHGYFYKRGPGGYVIVDAPLGAVVEAIPSRHKVIIINGKTYYYYNDIYFVKKDGDMPLSPILYTRWLSCLKRSQLLITRKQPPNNLL